MTPFRMEVVVSYSLHTSFVNDSTFEDVMLCLWDANGTVIAERNLGTFSGRDEIVKNISVKTDSVPRYIFPHHPRFYEIEPFGTGGYSFIPSQEIFRSVTIGSVPFDPRRLERGSCTVPS